MAKKLKKFCYRDKTRLCDSTCEAFSKKKVVYGIDIAEMPIVGNCVAISGYVLPADPHAIRKFLRNK